MYRATRAVLPRTVHRCTGCNWVVCRAATGAEGRTGAGLCSMASFSDLLRRAAILDRYRLVMFVDTMDSKDRFREIDSDSNDAHGRTLQYV